MILPDNGKAVVIDDKISEVQGLFAALSSKKVPFVYYSSEEGKDLPVTPLDNVRLIFLDLLLVDDSARQEPKQIVSNIVARLKKVINKDNGPYVLVYWSNKTKEYYDEFKKEFAGSLKEYKPLIEVMLDKSKNNDIDYIVGEMEKKFNEQFGALNAFLFWESTVNKSGGNVVNEFAGFKLPEPATPDQSLKNILYKLAKAVDENGVDDLDDESKMKKAFDPVNEVLLDLLYSNIENCEWPKITEINPSGSGDDENYTASINARLHLRKLTSAQEKKALRSGNLYFIDIAEENGSQVSEIISRNISGTISNKYFIKLDVSPQCDYAQREKIKCVRLLPGIMFEYSDTTIKIKGNADYRYGQCPAFFIDGKKYGIVFDFGYLTSEIIEEFKKQSLEAKYTIGIKLLADIQAKLARHINRPGITTIQ